MIHVVNPFDSNAVSSLLCSSGGIMGKKYKVFLHLPLLLKIVRICWILTHLYKHTHLCTYILSKVKLLFLHWRSVLKIVTQIAKR